MCEDDLISVILPVRNITVPALKQCIDSVIFQTHRNFELIIISEEETAEVKQCLCDYSQRDSRVQVLSLTSGKNLPYALNQGLYVAAGRFVARMDADDICLPSRLQVQLNFLKINTNISLVGSNVVLFNELQEGPIRVFPEHYHQIKKTLRYKNPLCHPAIMVRKADLEAVGLYDESFDAAEDYELWSRFVEKGYKIANIQEPLLKYYTPKNETRGEKNWHFNLKVKKKYLCIDQGILISLTAIFAIYCLQYMPNSIIISLYKIRKLKGQTKCIFLRLRSGFL